MLVNEMNVHNHLDHKLQFDFLINIVRPKKRFAKWSKTEHHDDLEAVVQYFGYSYEKAKQNFGFEPKITLDDGLQKTIDWYISQNN